MDLNPPWDLGGTEALPAIFIIRKRQKYSMKAAVIIIAVLVMAFVILYVAGGMLQESCSEIGTCKACWQNRETEMQSELCSNPVNCTASPEKQEHNARIDTILCACNTAGSTSYSDKELNAMIEKEAQVVLGYLVSADELCTQPGNYMVKKRY